MDEFGVYQVYTPEEEAKKQSEEEEDALGDVRKPCYKIPTLKEYFKDLDFVLNVVADGPTKTFSVRRLKYLEAKWTMYTMINEQFELA